MEKKQTFIINALYCAIILVLLYLVLHYLVPVTMPFIIAFVVAAIVVKLSRWLSARLHLAQTPLTLICIALFYALFFWAVFTGGTSLFSAGRRFFLGLPELYRSQILPFLNMLFDKIEDLLSEADPLLVATVEDSFTQFTDSLGAIVSDASVTVVRLISAYLTGIPSTVIRVIITVISTFFIATDFDRIVGFCARLLPKKWTGFLITMKDYSKNVILAYVRSYLLLMLITFTELTVGLLLLHIPYAVWIALGIAVFDLMPILGTGGILLPWVFVELVIGDYSMAIGILVLYLIITVVRNLLEPRLVGRQIGLPPLVTLFALFVGMSLFGLAGLIAFPVCLSALFNMERSGVIHIFTPAKENASDPEAES